jgi:hypothetical protein
MARARAIDLMQGGFLTDDGQWSATAPPPAAAWSMMDDRRRQIKDNSWDYAMSGEGPTNYLGGGSSVGPLPDRAWDGFFGAMAMRENATRAQGGRTAVDYMGKGPGSDSGFGFWKANVDDGVSTNLADPGATDDLARARGAAEADRARQQNYAVQPREEEHGIFSQPDVGHRPQSPLRRRRMNW